MKKRKKKLTPLVRLPGESDADFEKRKAELAKRIGPKITWLGTDRKKTN